MQRCFSSLGCPELSLGEIQELAQRHAIHRVELRALRGSLELAGQFAAEFGTPAGCAAWRRSTGSPVQVVALNTSLRLMGALPSDRDELCAFAPWADALGARWLRVFDGGTTLDDAELADATELVEWWLAMRHRNGWRAELLVETHEALVTAAAVSRFSGRLPGTALLWDAHHTWRKSGEDPAATWQAIRPGVMHIHVKDSVALASARHPFTYVLPGAGDFPMANLRARLQADGYEGMVSLEWEKQWHPYLPTLDEALRVAAARGWW